MNKRYIIRCHRGTSTAEHDIPVFAPDLNAAKEACRQHGYTPVLQCCVSVTNFVS